MWRTDFLQVQWSEWLCHFALFFTVHYQNFQAAALEVCWSNFEKGRWAGHYLANKVPFPDMPLVVGELPALISMGSAISTTEWLFVCSHRSSQKWCHDLWLWFGLCAQWMLLNKQAHCRDWGGMDAVMLVSQSAETHYTRLHMSYPRFCTIALDKFSVDLDESVTDGPNTDGIPLCRQQNDTALWNLPRCKKQVTAACATFAFNQRFSCGRACRVSPVFVTAFHRGGKKKKKRGVAMDGWSV